MFRSLAWSKKEGEGSYVCNFSSKAEFCNTKNVLWCKVSTLRVQCASLKEKNQDIAIVQIKPSLRFLASCSVTPDKWFCMWKYYGRLAMATLSLIVSEDEVQYRHVSFMTVTFSSRVPLRWVCCQSHLALFARTWDTRAISHSPFWRAWKIFPCSLLKGEFQNLKSSNCKSGFLDYQGNNPSAIDCKHSSTQAKFFNVSIWS